MTRTIKKDETVRMNLHEKILEWLLPLDGLRVKVQHQGIQKLCNRCYGHQTYAITSSLYMDTI